MNMTHTNTTVHPTKLCLNHSTAYGDPFLEGVASTVPSSTLYVRDQHRNLRQVGGDGLLVDKARNSGAMLLTIAVLV